MKLSDLTETVARKNESPTPTNGSSGQTIEDAQQYIWQHRRRGVACPCCDRVCKVYKRTVTGGMARWLKDWVIENLADWNGDVITKRHDALILFDVKDGNPNEDPDTGEARVDHDTGHGLVSHVCLKRKNRNYLDKDGESILVKEDAVLDAVHKAADKRAGGTKKNGKDVRTELCREFFDARAFGAVITGIGRSCHIVGPIQMTIARSFDPVVPITQSITRSASAKEKTKKVQGKDGETTEKTTQSGKFGNMSFLNYGLYRSNIFVSPANAQRPHADSQKGVGFQGTGFTNRDLARFYEGLLQMFEHDHTARSGTMTTQRVIGFEHPDWKGTAKAHDLFKRVKVTRREGVEVPLSYDDYEVTIDTEGLGRVTAWEYLLDPEDGLVRRQLG